MENANLASNNFMQVADIIQIAILIGILTQAFLIWRTYKLDHIRRKNQATLDHITTIRETYRPIRRKIFQYLDENDDKFDEFDTDVIEDIKLFLSILEHFSTGVNEDVFSLELVERMSGAYLMASFNRLKGYIDWSRTEGNNPYYFEELETMTNNISRLRKARPPKKSKTHS